MIQAAHEAMNQLDYAIVAIAALGAIYGLARGALRMATSTAALIAGIYIASIYYSRVAGFAEQELALKPTTAAAIGYVVVFVAVFAAIAVAGGTFARLLHIARLGWIDRLCGAALGVAAAGAVAGLMLMTLTAILPAGAPLLGRSELAPRVLRYTESLIAYIPAEFKETYQSKRAELARLWFESGAPTPTESPSPGAR